MRQRLRQATNYLCYYGRHGLEIISKTDAAMLAAEAYTTDELALLNKAGTVTLGYLSLGQDACPQAEAWVRRSADGEVQKDAAWGVHLVDPSHPAWQARVTATAAELLERGYSGLFLDTLDSDRAEDQAALVDIVQMLRAAHPDAPITINRGFALLPHIAHLIDAVMFESLSCTWLLESDGRVSYDRVAPDAFYFNQLFALKVANLAKLHGFNCLALDYTDSPTLEQHARAVALGLGFKSFCADRLLSRLPAPRQPSIFSRGLFGARV